MKNTFIVGSAFCALSYAKSVSAGPGATELPGDAEIFRLLEAKNDQESGAWNVVVPHLEPRFEGYLRRVNDLFTQLGRTPPAACSDATRSGGSPRTLQGAATSHLVSPGHALPRGATP